MERILFGKRIKETRKSHNLTAKQLAELCHIDDTFLRQIEGGTKLPSLPVFVDLCNVLCISPAYLLKDSLSHNEYAELGELSLLWEQATYDQIKLVTTLVKAALIHIETDHL